MQNHHWYKRIGERAAKLVADRGCFFARAVSSGSLIQLTIVSTKNEYIGWFSKLGPRMI
jgi:hypothetical protein